MKRVGIRHSVVILDPGDLGRSERIGLLLRARGLFGDWHEYVGVRAREGMYEPTRVFELILGSDRTTELLEVLDAVLPHEEYKDVSITTETVMVVTP